MQKWEEDLLATTPAGGHFHSLEPPPRDGNHLNFLYDWANQADKKEGLENDGNGKLPARWGPIEFWQRSKIPEMRKAFSKLTLQEREKVLTVEDLGFVYPGDGKAKPLSSVWGSVFAALTRWWR